MLRIVPEVRALCERVRRLAVGRVKGWIPADPALRERAHGTIAALVIAAALMAPAGGLLLRGVLPAGGERWVEAAGSTAGALEEKVERAKAVDGPIAAAWRQRALEREREEGAARFAAEYGISPELARRIHDAAVESDIDPRIAFGLVRTESGFRRTVVSHAGAVGYTQLLPSTARWLEPGTTRQDLFDPDKNLRLGFRYLRYLLDKYDGNVRLALTAYNRGPGTVDRVLRRGGDPDNGYARRVLRRG